MYGNAQITINHLAVAVPGAVPMACSQSLRHKRLEVSLGQGDLDDLLGNHQVLQRNGETMGICTKKTVEITICHGKTPGKIIEQL